MQKRSTHYHAINFIQSTRKDAKQGEGRWRCRILNPQHKQIASKMHDTQSEAEDWGQDYLYSLRKGIKAGMSETVDPTLTVGDLIDRFLNDERGGRDWPLHRIRQLNYWRESIGSIGITGIEPWQIEDALDAFMEQSAEVWSPKLQKSIPTGKPRSVATGNRRLSAIKAVFRWANKPPKGGPRGQARHALMAHNPAASITAAAERNERTNHLSREQIAAVLEHATASEWSRYRCFLLGLITTGCRKSEWHQMTWDRIDLDAATAFIPGDQTKNGEDKTLELTDALVAELRRIQAESPAIGATLVFPSEVKPTVPRSPRIHWDRTRKDLGLEDFCLHDLRHTAASVWLAAGHSLPKVAKALGHKKTSSSDRYAHLSQEARRDMNGAMDGIG